MSAPATDESRQPPPRAAPVWPDGLLGTLLGPRRGPRPEPWRSPWTLLRLVGPGSVPLALALFGIAATILRSSYGLDRFTVPLALVVPLARSSARRSWCRRTTPRTAWAMSAVGLWLTAAPATPERGPQPWPWTVPALIAYLVVRYAISSRERPWRPVLFVVRVLNAYALPVYRWHQTALLLVVAAATVVGFGPGLVDDPDALARVGRRLLWLPLLAAVLAVLCRPGDLGRSPSGETAAELRSGSGSFPMAAIDGPTDDRGMSTTPTRSAGGTDRLRVSDAERDRAVALLREAYAEGRLDYGELDRRIGAALVARTRADLGAVLRGLPAPGRVPAPSGPAPSSPRVGRMVGGVVGDMVGDMAAGPPSSLERSWAMVAHLIGLVTLFLGPLVIAASKGRSSGFVREQAREAANFHLTYLGALVVLGLVSAMTFGAAGVLFGPLGIAWTALTAVGGVSAALGNHFRYPWSLRLFG